MSAGLWQQIGRRLLPLGWAAVVAAPFAAHVALATGRYAALATLLLAVELALLGSLALQRLHGVRRIAATVVLGAALLLTGMRLLGPGWAGNAGLIAASALSHALIYGSLLMLFARSLRPGQTDLITGLATRLRGALTPEMLRYTRSVTKAWCVFFAGQLALSAVLLAAAPHAAWSLFVNVLDGPSVVLMFAGEYAIRRWRFRNYSHISPVETVRTFARTRAARP